MMIPVVTLLGLDKDPQRWDAYDWERSTIDEHCPELTKIDIEESVDLMFKCADIYDIAIPRYYFVPEENMEEGVRGTAERDKCVRLSLTAPTHVAIHEMAHIIVYQKKQCGVEAHGKEFCGVLAFLYERLGFWPPQIEHQDIEIMDREELFDAELLPESEYSFNNQVKRWLRTNGRIDRINKGLTASLEEQMKAYCKENPDATWLSHALDAGATPTMVIGEPHNDDFLEFAINPCHTFGLVGAWQCSTFEDFKKIVKKNGVNKTLNAFKNIVMEEIEGQYEEYISYNYGEFFCIEEEEETEHVTKLAHIC
tara:strand:- start:37970 stop:38899 length:930 start_codon:yes stop_codon:yes gene_type:complete